MFSFDQLFPSPVLSSIFNGIQYGGLYSNALNFDRFGKFRWEIISVLTYFRLNFFASSYGKRQIIVDSRFNYAFFLLCLEWCPQIELKRLS